jgi:hypothetical protein
MNQHRSHAYTGLYRAAASLLLMAAIAAGPRTLQAQASAIPSAQSAPVDEMQHGRQLLAEMVTALGGDAWLHRQNYDEVGNFGHFFHGVPNDIALKFEEFHEYDPAVTRQIVITHSANPILQLLGAPIGKDHRDVVEVFTGGQGYEITFKGKQPLPVDIVADFERNRTHTVDAVVDKWLEEPGVTVLYEGTEMVSRRPADKVTVLNARSDAITLLLDQTTHLPLVREYRYRDTQFGDFDTDREEYGNYQRRQGIMTAFDVSRSKNGELVSQRFLLSIRYNAPLDAKLFDPDAPLATKQPKH